MQGFPSSNGPTAVAVSDNIRVCARFRPLNRQEEQAAAASTGLVSNTSLAGGSAAPGLSSGGGQASPPGNKQPPLTVCVRNLDDVSVEVVTPDHEAFPFMFSRVYHPETHQESVYRDVGEPMIRDILLGYNACIFVYGQTGSGKTYTMMGANAAAPDAHSLSSVSIAPSSARPAALSSRGGPNATPPPVFSDPCVPAQSAFFLDGPHAGIIPRAVNDLFGRIATADPDLEFDIKLFFVEIYMEHVRDLLEPSRTNLNVREDPNSNSFYVDGCESPYVSSAQEVLGLVELGLRNRTTAATKMNDVSSRSHCLLGITIKSTHAHRGETKVGKLYLVDLAGTEKVAKTKAEGVQLEEAKLINKSLTTLGLVIKNLTEGRSSHIPYRDSKLTKILQDALGGNSRTSLIVCCSPSSLHYQETHSTLRFGARAKHIKNRAVVNKEYTPSELKHLLILAQGEIAKKNAEIDKLRRGGVPNAGTSASATAGAETTDGNMGAQLAAQEEARRAMRELELEAKLAEQKDLFVAQLDAKDDSIREQEMRLTAAHETITTMQSETVLLNEEISAWQLEYNTAHQELTVLAKRLDKERQARAVDHSLLEKLLDSSMKARLDVQNIRSWCLEGMRELQLGSDTASVIQQAANSAILTTAVTSSLQFQQQQQQSATSGAEISSYGHGGGVFAAPDETAQQLPQLTLESARAAISTLTQRLQTVEKQYVDLELTWRELVTENGSLMLELQLADKKLAIRHDRIENLKAGLKQERQMSRETIDDMEIERRQMKEKLIEARSDAEYWRHRFEALNITTSMHSSSVGHGSRSSLTYRQGSLLSNGSAAASPAKVGNTMSSFSLSSPITPNTSAPSRVVKHIRGGGGGSHAGSYATLATSSQSHLSEGE